MEKRQLLRSISLVTTAAVTLNPMAGVAKDNKKQTKPNVIFIFTDQHRADVFSYTGNPDVQTPAFDKMAKDGVVFNRAYCQDAISAPSRNSLFTGLYPRTLGLMDNPLVHTSTLDNAVSIQSTLKENGYKTYAFGKRHLYSASDQGWDVLKSHSEKENPEDNYVKWIEEQGYAKEFGEDWAAEFGRYPNGNSLSGTQYPIAPMGTRTTKLPAECTMEAYSAQETIRVIKEHAESGEPFFCFTSFYRPHQPYNPLPEYLAKHNASAWGEGRNNGSSVAMPASLREPAENLTPFMTNLRKKPSGVWCLGVAAEDEQLYRDYIVAYYALVEEIDHHVGQIFEELEKSGLAENTIVIYASDHGDFVGNHGMIEKAAAGQNVYEETLRVPLMFYWKGKLENSSREDLVELVDIYPTIVELTGAKLPELGTDLQGQSLVSTLIKGKDVKRDYIVSESWYQATVVTKDSKLGIWLDPGPMYDDRDWRESTNFFFDRASDPIEVNNLYSDQRYSNKIKKLEQLYIDFTESISDEGKQQWIKYLNENK